MAGALVALEGIDQAGKETQALAVQERARAAGIACEVRGYPDYETPIGRLIHQSLRESGVLDSRTRAMLFAANRWEKDGEIRALLQQDALVLVDRYTASNVVYGASQGLDSGWLCGLETGLAEAHLTLFVDIPAAESARRKSRDRDGFERDLALLETARRHYLRLASELGWAVVDGTRPASEVTRDILAALQARLAGRYPPIARVRL